LLSFLWIISALKAVKRLIFEHYILASDDI